MRHHPLTKPRIRTPRAAQEQQREETQREETVRKDAVKLHFLSGNEHKIREFTAILSEYDIVVHKLALPEIQSLDPKEVIAAKLLAAHEQGVPEPAIVEDTSFWVGETGFPGPLFKFMYARLGRAGIVRFARAFNATTGAAECHIGLLAKGETWFVSGKVTGKIVDARGENGFAFDPIFQPDGYTKTFGEMPEEEKNKISHRRLALMQLRDLLKEKL
ncbi:non-canonical purine NTP pyrophosphatase [Candidatus Woesearchaeota archaeon]|nr:MAG: non-canonical purine NTP pyrophosphatase [Candidatus Woesearchaeota archaeon]